MTPDHCTHCQSVVFFENVACGACGARLAFDPARSRMLAYREDLAELAGDGTGTAASTAWVPWCEGDAVPPGVSTRPCRNRLAHDNCNWMLDDDAPHGLCRSCRLTRTIPDLSVPGNAARWARIEQAKRRLVHGLMRLGLRPEPRQDDAADDADPAARGLCFDLLADTPDAPPVRTGHDQGVIVLNIAEADDAHREAVRVAMGEPLRTLLGHLRHEVSHYLQYRWVDSDAARQLRCRAVFGDERADYAQALQQHYAQGPADDWAGQHISAYASAHPWEDWAETCAHWLLIVDAVETAAAWGLRIDGPARARPQTPDAGSAAQARELVIDQWLPVAQFLNAMNRSIGLHDSYPFLMPPAVVHKLQSVATLLAEAAGALPAARGAAPAAAPSSPPSSPAQRPLETTL